jgi:peptide chain release factor subunit 1
MENYIEIWKMKKLVQRLKEARGAGTSVITLIIPPGSQVSQFNKLLTEEYGTATNIKSRVNRLSVLDAITSTQQRLKMYNKIPPNGLLLFCGTVLTEEGKEKRLTIDIEPFKPINKSLYMCDNKFHVDVLKDLLQDEEIFGFIIVNGDGCLYATVQGNTRNILHYFTVELPKKHRRGGQSSVRFARLRMEARHNYLRKVAELCTQFFITENKCNVKGLILAGSADFKQELNKSDLFDNRLKEKVLQTYDLAYGATSGLNEAIELASEVIGNLRLYHEKKLMQQFFTEIAIDSGKYCYGLKESLMALEMGAVEILMVWEELKTECKILKHKNTDKTIIWIENEYDDKDYIFIEQILFIDWIANHYKDFGTQLEFVTDNSQEGTQFIKGFSGVGGLLRWKVNFEELEE